MKQNNIQSLAFRLQPGQDLKVELDHLVQTEKIDAACILTCVGSLSKAVLRFANQNNATTLTGHFEIVSLTGTFSTHGSHYHIAIADKHGNTKGAHLLEGCTIYTTAEIVIGVMANTSFLRILDPQTGFAELEVSQQ